MKGTATEKQSTDKRGNGKEKRRSERQRNGTESLRRDPKRKSKNTAPAESGRKDGNMEDLELARETLKNTKYLKSKYPQWRIEELADILGISEMYGIPLKEFYSYSYGYFLNGGHGFNFEILKKPLLTNSETHYKPSDSVWHMLVDNGGCGRLNFCGSYDSHLLYGDKANDVWDRFNDTILAYHPYDYDRINMVYIFSVQNGYELYKDFDEIYTSTKKEFEECIKEYRVRELEEKLAKLKGVQ